MSPGCPLGPWGPRVPNPGTPEPLDVLVKAPGRQEDGRSATLFPNVPMSPDDCDPLGLIIISNFHDYLLVG